MVRAMNARPIAVILMSALALGAAPATAGEGAWGNGLKASVRLIASGLDADGKLVAGIEVVMPPGWHTYWRTPGDAGLAPSFDFSASRNVADVAVAFPVPTRLDDGFSVTNVYYDRVVFPVSAVAVDPAKPVALSVSVELGVCAEICVPDSVTADIDVPPGESDPVAAAILAAALALVPMPSEPGAFAVASAARYGGSDKRPVFRFGALVPDAASADVFVEGPDDWSAYLPVRAAAPGGEVAWTVKFSRLGATVPADGATFRVTLISAGRAIEQTVVAD
jgi:suppressor for copper-sensitivity B